MEPGGTDLVPISDVLSMASDIGARAGIDLALLWLNAKDPIERQMYESMYYKIVEKREMMNQNLATDIANAVGKLFG